jgi:hypothetical protein
MPRSLVAALAAAAAALLLVIAPVLASDRAAERSALPAPAAISASDLRLTLGRLLGEHAYLTMEAMRAAASERADTEALLGGVASNTEELAAAIASVYGDDAGTAFRALWETHIDALLDWSKARAANDRAGEDAALAKMAEFKKEFSDFLSSANPHLSGDAEALALQLHVDQLTSFVDMDYDQVFATARAAYSHMFDFGDALARAIARQFPEKIPEARVAFSPRTTLRRELGRYLGEHLILAAEAMRSALDVRPDAEAARTSLDANGDDLAALIGQVYGPEAGQAFADLWKRHIDLYLQYIEAVRAGDSETRQQALDQLEQYHTELATFLHGAIPALSVEDLESLIRHHVTALINQVDAAAAGDYERSVAVTREAYRHMFEVGDALGNAIADQFPDRFADLEALPVTATDRMEPRSTGTGAAVLVALLGAAALILLMTSGGIRRLR